MDLAERPVAEPLRVERCEHGEEREHGAPVRLARPVPAEQRTDPAAVGIHHQGNGLADAAGGLEDLLRAEVRRLDALAPRAERWEPFAHRRSQ